MFSINTGSACECRIPLEERVRSIDTAVDRNDPRIPSRGAALRDARHRGFRPHLRFTAAAIPMLSHWRKRADNRP